ISHFHARADLHGARVGLRRARDELEERRLPGAVHPHDAPPLAAADEEIEAVVDDLAPVSLLDLREARDVLARARRRAKIELHHLSRARRLDALDLVELLHARLHLRGVRRARLEAVDEALLLGEHRLLALEL